VGSSAKMMAGLFMSARARATRWTPPPRQWQIVAVSADMRVVLETAENRRIVAWAVQKTNLSAFLGRLGRPEKVASKIVREQTGSS